MSKVAICEQSRAIHQKFVTLENSFVIRGWVFIHQSRETQVKRTLCLKMLEILSILLISNLVDKAFATCIQTMIQVDAQTVLVLPSLGHFNR